MRSRFVLTLLALALASCVSSTAVGPAPLAPEDEAQLRCTLLGTWRLAAIDAEPETMVEQTWEFRADGTGTYRQGPGSGPGAGMVARGQRDYQWRVDGRNIHLTAGNETVYRADRFADARMTWFNYTQSNVYSVERVAPATTPCAP